MRSKLANSQVSSYALGITPQTSVYGSAIYQIYGRTRSPLQLIWCANLRKASGSSKATKSKKNSPPTYAENVDFLIGYNPIAGVLQCWQNQNQKLPLNFSVQSTTITNGVDSTVTISDPNFYFIVGVTLTIPYNQTFNDYGGQGAVNVSGNYELPLWNSAFAGPDRVNASGWRWYPYIYRWVPYSGNIIDIDINAKGKLLGPLGLSTAALKVYYAQIPTGGGQNPIPLSALRLAFESELGSGSEYADANLSSQQILYPQFAGLGSSNLDLGTTQAAPQIVAEVMGAFPLYSTGDADFADMIEDIFRGTGQAGFTQSPFVQGFSDLYHGLDCYEFPGTVQKKLRTASSPFGSVVYDIAVTKDKTIAGDGVYVPSILIVIARNTNGAALSISDTLGSTWNRMLPGGPYPNMEVWYAATPASGYDTVTIAPTGGSTDIELIELQGLDTVGGAGITSTYQTGTSQTISGSIALPAGSLPNRPGYILAVVICDNGSTSVQPSAPPSLWKNLMVGQGLTWSMYRIINADNQTYSFSVRLPSFVGTWHLFITAFTNSQPVPWPVPFGEILDATSMQLVRNQCRANGLFGSLLLDSQKKASDNLADLYYAANAAPVWSGFKLKSIPYSEVSTVGNGAVYSAPTASGPVANLAIADFVKKTDGSYIKIHRTGQIDRPNVLQIQHPNRDSDYNEVTESEPDPGAISTLGVRQPEPAKVLKCVQDVTISRSLLGVAVRRANYVNANLYEATLKAKCKLLEPMDLVTLPSDTQSGIVGPLPVRIKSIQESDTFDLDCVFERFVYGACSPTVGAVGTPDPYQADTNYTPVNINTPIIFEPIGQLAGFPTINELWLLLSCNDSEYGGCDVWVSTDGGTSYNLIDTIFGNATTGVLLSDWPAATDPDMTNDLSVNLTESLGTLISRSASDKDNFVYPCYVAGVTHWTDLASTAGTKIITSAAGGFSPGMVGNTIVITSGTHFTPGTYLVDVFNSATSIHVTVDPTTGGNGSVGVGDATGLIPYEIMSYGTVTLIAANEYDLHANSGGVVWLRRAVAGCPLPQQGVDHPTGSRFAFLDPSMQGWGIIAIDPTWIGKTLSFKFSQFNKFGGGKQSLQNATAYQFTPQGLTLGVSTSANSVNYNLSPQSPLVAVVADAVKITAFDCQFPTSTVKYITRSFAEEFPVDWWNQRIYVTIYDPSYQGDFGASWSDLATSGAGSATVTSAAGGFSKSMIGQFLNITGGTNFTTGQYLIRNVTNTNTMTLANSPTLGGAGSAGAGNLLLQAFYELTNAKVGAPGYTYVGSVFVDGVSGANTVILPGGFPLPGNISMNGKLIG